ncbi:hypothetical protein Hypma_002700 [Hypsizygus marmoreus]|uniref:Uncharacterized protein n=1 Tax=Hypsizygus marmoreus TaxID=39966 RepID=A0A369JB20_HYPMA|nr:hypothetical protein Hypma_002700 [Hypsizygus marmoreus]
MLWITPFSTALATRKYISHFALYSFSLVYWCVNWYLARQLRLYAPWIQTNVRRIRVTPEIAARLRRGEEVSPERLQAGLRRADSGGGRHGPLQAAEPRTVLSQRKTNRSLQMMVTGLSLTGPKERAKGKKR